MFGGHGGRFEEDEEMMDMYGRGHWGEDDDDLGGYGDRRGYFGRHDRDEEYEERRMYEEMMRRKKREKRRGREMQDRPEVGGP